MKQRYLDRLEAVDAISKVSAPPLKVLPGMKRKAQKYKEAGIENANDLLKANTQEVAKALEIDEERIDADKVKVQSYLIVDKPKGG